MIEKKYFVEDFKAGVTVFLVAIPLCLGIALASGVPIMSGLIAGIVGGVVVGKLSGSHLSVSGPAAGLVAIVLAASYELGSYNMVLTSLILAGLLQFIFGKINAGVVAHYIPHSVVKGMLAAIGIILITKQVPYALGMVSGWSLGHKAIGAMVITVLSFSLMYLITRPSIKKNKFFMIVPVSLFVIATGALANILMINYFPDFAQGAGGLVSLPDLFSNSSESIFVQPDFSALTLGATYKYAFIFAIIASIETLLCIEATDKLDPQKRVTPTSQELKAQGIGNILCGFLGGLPVTSVIVRSSVNIENKAKSKRSTIIHGLLLLVSVLVAGPLINQIPLASLACILLIVGYKLTSHELVKNMFNQGTSQFAPFGVTVVAVLVTDLLSGVGIGLLLSIFLTLRNYYTIQDFDSVQLNKETNTYTHTFSEYLTFLTKANIEKKLMALPKNSHVELDFTKTKMIDHEVRETFKDFKNFATLNNINVSTLGNDSNDLKICYVGIGRDDVLDSNSTFVHHETRNPFNINNEEVSRQ